jgi:hypothetical protein
VKKMIRYDVSQVYLFLIAAIFIIAAAVLLGFAAHWCAHRLWSRVERVFLDRWKRLEDVIARRPLRRRFPRYRFKRYCCTSRNVLLWMRGSTQRYVSTSYLEDKDNELARRARRILREKGALRRNTRFQQKSVDRLVNDQAAVLIDLHALNIFTVGDIRHRQQDLERRLQRIQRDLRELDHSRIDHSHYMSFDDEG